MTIARRWRLAATAYTSFELSEHVPSSCVAAQRGWLIMMSAPMPAADITYKGTTLRKAGSRRSRLFKAGGKVEC